MHQEDTMSLKNETLCVQYPDTIRFLKKLLDDGTYCNWCIDHTLDKPAETIIYKTERAEMEE